MPDPFDVTDFRFRDDNTHNAQMLEYQAEAAMLTGDKQLAAAFAQAAGLYAVSAFITRAIEAIGEQSGGGG